MDMIEIVARAICRRNYPRFSGADIDEMWDGWKEDATAAIKAMREPTPAMIDRFVSRALQVSIHSEGGWSDYARNQWQTMIDGALAGEGKDR